MSTGGDDAVCEHPSRPHTVWYWVEDGGPPIPMSRTFDTQPEAVTWAATGPVQVERGEAGADRLRWIKVFRADNEAYTCWRWENPLPYEPLPPGLEPTPLPARERDLPGFVSWPVVLLTVAFILLAAAFGLLGGGLLT